MRVVVDTNVLISAFIFNRSAPHQVLQLVRTGEVVIVLSTALFDELARVIRYPHLRQIAKYTDDQLDRFLTNLRETAVWVEVGEPLAVVTGDETDNRFVELAIAGNARYIISGDKRHLLKVRRYQGIEVVSAAEFLALIASSSA
jgi:putative PIN family toxin of toxin-antitoxin system